MFVDKDSVKIDGISMGQYLISVKYGYHKLWGKDSGRTLSGKQTGTLLGIFPKLTLNFRKLSNDELHYLAPHFDSARQTVEYKDANKGTMYTMETYSGDYEPEYKIPGKAEQFSLAFISIDRRT